MMFFSLSTWSNDSVVDLMVVMTVLSLNSEVEKKTKTEAVMIEAVTMMHHMCRQILLPLKIYLIKVFARPM